MKQTDDRNLAESIIKAVCTTVLPHLDEKRRRHLAGCMASAYGRGGESLVSRFTDMAWNTVHRGAEEIKNGAAVEDDGCVRKAGAGRKTEVDKHPEIEACVKELLERSTYGDPERVLAYTTLSLRKISGAVEKKTRFKVSRNIVARMLETLGYSRQQNRKMEQVGTGHPDRDVQFRHINDTAREYIRKGIPVISIDCKKKENLGNFANKGAEYRPKGVPRKVLDHDFCNAELGKVAPYGVYVVNDNTAFVNVGTGSDTAEFAANSVRRWWRIVGRHTFPGARRIYVTSDGGGSNGSRNRLWKYELARLAEETGLEIEVSHLPPGTSKWNKVEHRLFSYISRNWAGQPLINVETVVKLISSTTTSTGLKVVCKADRKHYKTGTKIKEGKFDSIDIEFCKPDTGWNYVIRGFKK